jgi:hypothetical protein
MHKSAQKTHWVIIRALAYKWIRILCRCWQQYIPTTNYATSNRSKNPLTLARLSCSTFPETA